MVAARRRPGCEAGQVALPAVVRDALDRYLLQRGLPVTRPRWVLSMPRVASLALAVHGRNLITHTRPRQELGNFFGLAADLVVDEKPELPAPLQQVSPH